MAQLTERQQQIVGLQKDGKKAPEIAEALGITTNAVYQQIRRMRGGAPKPKTAAKSGPKSAAKTTASSGTTSAATVTTTPAPAPRPLTPLQSLRARRDEISADIKEAQNERDTAQRAYTKAQEALEKLSGRHAEEMARLDAAEHALKGTTPVEATATATVTPAEAPAPATAKANGTTKRKTATQAVAEKKAKEEAAAAKAAPATQAEREATADFDPATPANTNPAQTVAI